VPPRPSHHLDQSAAPHQNQDFGGWPDNHGYDQNYQQESYWPQPPAQHGYEPEEPIYPQAPGGFGQTIQPTAPDPHFGQSQDSYHYPQEPGFGAYEPQPPAHPRGLGPGNGAPGFGAAEYPPYPPAQPAGFGQDPYGQPAESFTSQFGQSLQQGLDPFQQAAPQREAAVSSRFQDFMDPVPSLGGERASPFQDLKSHGGLGADRNSLRGADFDDWSRDAGTDDQGYDPSQEYGPGAAAHGDYAESGWDRQGYQHDSSQIFANAGYDANDLAVHSEYDEDEYEDEDEEPAERSRGARIGWILMAVAGLVVIGGGLAYGYKILLGPAGTQVADTPVVKSISEPPKVRPEEPGGRTFDHTDSKILGRLSEQRNAAANPEPLADDGSRRVSTVVVGRNGDIVAPQTAPTPSTPPPANPVVAVPGLTLVDGFGGGPQPMPREQAAAPQRPLVVQPPATTGPSGPAAKPVVISRAEPETPEPVAERAPPPAARPQPERVAARTAPAAPKPTAPVTTASTTPAGDIAGYVAVLASVPVSSTSRVDALAQYADIQQNYGSVLASRTPDVREADLGSRGRYHRLMVGPPGSKESAAELCAQLKAAGYSGCWITTY